MGLTEARLGGGGQLLSKYKPCALNPVKVTNYFCDKGSKNCWWVALRKVPGTSQRWAKGWSWNGIQPLLCDNQILPSLTVTPAPHPHPHPPSHSVDRHPEIGRRWWNKAEPRKEERRVQIPPPVWGLQCQTLGRVPSLSPHPRVVAPHPHPPPSGVPRDSS